MYGSRIFGYLEISLSENYSINIDLNEFNKKILLNLKLYLIANFLVSFLRTNNSATYNTKSNKYDG